MREMVNKGELNRTILVGVSKNRGDACLVGEYLDELERLVDTLGFEVICKLMVNLKQINPATFIGRGKVEEIKLIVKGKGINEVIFDDDLSPRQLKNLENLLGVEVTDRTGVILEIFAKHAKTKEAKTQVELASLQYLLPRLRRRWTHLERQIGGVGVRGGPGETQIEIDKRIIRERIAKLKKELMEIDKEREVQDKRRENFFRIALVGYTNTGKSTILNTLTSADVVAENKLFTTLDTTTRLWQIDKYHKALISDTIGFIRKLPHTLIASFRSTLKEVRDSDLIVKVADISTDQCLDQIENVNEVLRQIGADKKPYIIVFNKIDIMNRDVFLRAKRLYSDAIYISALNKLRINTLKERILREIEKEELEVPIELPLESVKEISLVRNFCKVLEEQYYNSTVSFRVKCYRKVWNWLKYQLSKS
ncbi:MAG: GTPase HflX [Candidatus Marinimicrobia bacterium]|nr:GTPase HflX [Candidatus Neomarinimicrobiota bacterium]